MGVQMVEMVEIVKKPVLLVLLVPLVQWDVVQGKSRSLGLISSIGFIG